MIENHDGIDTRDQYEKATGGPAFPTTHQGLAKGMTLLDYFAGQVASGFVQGDSRFDDPEYIAAESYRLAGALLRHRPHFDPSATE